jgi:two-component system chemotaxis response regulator CheY
MSQKILTVDDALYMRAMIKDILSGQGYEICEADSGEAGVETYEAEQPDLVLMDITMPGMDGISATKEILSADPSAQVIICSAIGQKQMVLEAVKAGACEYIVKPFEPDEVLEVVGRTLTAQKAA